MPVLLHVQLVDVAQQVLQLGRAQHLREDVCHVLLSVDSLELDARLLGEEEAVFGVLLHVRELRARAAADRQARGI
eukprot:12770967-Alexandrium_andersonii.AAC.1